MVIVGVDDQYVDGPRTAAYFAKHHPAVRFHLMERWAHGGFWEPANLPTLMVQLCAFLCDTNAVDSSPVSPRALQL